LGFNEFKRTDRTMRSVVMINQPVPFEPGDLGVFVEGGWDPYACVTAGTLVADDGEIPVGSIFVVDAKDRAAVDSFTRSDPYHLNSVWGNVQSTVTIRSVACQLPASRRTD